jgi:hypothetical protein
VESDRFDDVGFRMIEAPSPPPQRPRRRGVLAAGAVLVACGLGLGASAFADSSAPAPAKPSVVGDQRFDHHGGCHHGFRHQPDSSALRY